MVVVTGMTAAVAAAVSCSGEMIVVQWLGGGSGSSSCNGSGDSGGCNCISLVL